MICYSPDPRDSKNVWFIFVAICGGCIHIMTGLIYRHPASDINEFTNSLEIKLMEIYNAKPRCIICGDINIDALKIDTHNPTSKFINTIMIHNFIPQILIPTRITENSVTLIDHIILKTNLKSSEDINTVVIFIVTSLIIYPISY